MKITGAQVFDLHNGFVSRDLYLDGELISTEDKTGETLDASGLYAIPGLTDVHFHGAMGYDLSDADPQGLEAIAQYELSRGVTQICPAGMTLLEDQLIKVCETAAAHVAANKPGAELVGIHLEGPFLSMAKKGAQNGAWLHAPDVDMFHRLQTASGGMVKLVSIAPEEPGGLDFIKAVAPETMVSLAHTTAGYDVAATALAEGAGHITHCFNAMPAFAHRDPSVVGAAFDAKHSRVELIVDGIHIHPAMVRATFQLFGPERMVLVSDTMRAVGMPDGSYTLGGQDVTKQGRRATLADGTIAGSATDLMDCMRTAVSFGIPLHDAVRAAAVNSAQAIGIFDQYGTLDPGKCANIVLLDQDLNLKAVIFKGKLFG